MNSFNHSKMIGTCCLVFVLFVGIAITYSFGTAPVAYSQSSDVPTPFIVTATPTPEDVFEAATRSAALEELIASVGTPTLIPLNWVLATETPTPYIVTATPTAESAATATVMIAQETAIAFTTGEPDGEVIVVTPTPEPVPTYITPTPRAPDVLALATRAAAATALVQTAGSPTPTPTNWQVARIVVLPNIDAADDRAAAELEAEAIIFTNDADNVVFQTATPRPPRPLPTWTPVAVSISSFTPTPVAVNAPFPTSLIGKIMFLSDVYTGNPRRAQAFVMNPDGSGLSRLSSLEFYERAKQRDSNSADRRYFAHALKEQSGERQIQIFFDDHFWGSKKQLTYFGSGVTWDPAWSPVEDLVAFVSNDTGNDEIWVGRPDEWPATKLTDNQWQWDKGPSFSPDGQQIIFMSNRNGRQQIWIMDKNGANQRVFVDLAFDAWAPVWVKYGDQ